MSAHSANLIVVRRDPARHAALHQAACALGADRGRRKTADEAGGAHADHRPGRPLAFSPARSRRPRPARARPDRATGAGRAGLHSVAVRLVDGAALAASPNRPSMCTYSLCLEVAQTGAVGASAAPHGCAWTPSVSAGSTPHSCTRGQGWTPTTPSPPRVDLSFRPLRRRRGSRRLGPLQRSVRLVACRGREGGECSVQQFAEVLLAVARTPLPEDDPQDFERRRYANVGDDRCPVGRGGCLLQSGDDLWSPFSLLLARLGR